jgi:hypothetical protein
LKFLKTPEQAARPGFPMEAPSGFPAGPYCYDYLVVSIILKTKSLKSCFTTILNLYKMNNYEDLIMQWLYQTSNSS